MDARLKKRTHEDDLALRDELYKAIKENAISIPDAIRLMQKVSRLTQPEFAAHRGVGAATLRQILSGEGNPTVETINKIVSIFGLEVGLVPKRAKPKAKHLAKPYAAVAGPEHDGAAPAHR